jgi:tripartite-type tricarboxylate transporter receptor subunit TctC
MPAPISILVKGATCAASPYKATGRFSPLAPYTRANFWENPMTSIRRLAPAFALASAASFAAASLMAAPASAQSIESFYKDRSVDMIIGAAPGGGYDIYARLVSRHLGKHIPGNPNTVPKNMPGAGSNKAAQFIYAVAPKDGTVMGAIFTGGIMEPLLGDAKAVQHDPTKLIYLGSANREVSLCIIRTDAPAKSFKEVLEKEVIFGASAAGGSSRDFPSALNNVLGAKINLVSGYPGTKEMGLAVERNETQGMCGYFWSSLSTQNPSWIDSKDMRLLVQETSEGHPELNKRGVPVAVDFAKSPEDRQVLELIYAQLIFGRPYILPPGVPEDRVKALRAAFSSTLKDPALLADAQKSRVDIDAVSGEDVQALVTKLFATPKNIIQRAREAQIPKK